MKTLLLLLSIWGLSYVITCGLISQANPKESKNRIVGLISNSGEAIAAEAGPQRKDIEVLVELSKEFNHALSNASKIAEELEKRIRLLELKDDLRKIKKLKQAPLSAKKYQELLRACVSEIDTLSNELKEMERGK